MQDLLTQDLDTLARAITKVQFILLDSLEGLENTQSRIRGAKISLHLIAGHACSPASVL